MDNYNKLFSIIRQTDLLNYDEKNELKLYLMNLERQVKEQKQVIDKIFSRITLLKMEDITIETSKVLDELLDILKEVSE